MAPNKTDQQLEVQATTAEPVIVITGEQRVDLSVEVNESLLTSVNEEKYRKMARQIVIDSIRKGNLR